MQPGVFEEVKRKTAHFAGVAWVIASYFITIPQTILILAGFFLAALINALFHKYVARVPLIGALSDFLHSMARKEERSAKIYFGAVYFFGSLILLLYATQSLPIFRAAALVLIFADGFSAIFGKAFGKTALPYNPYKSVEGSLAGFIAASVAAAFVLPVYFAILVALVGTLIESMPLEVNDNLTIPLGVGFFLWLFL